jgi:hypothetical protein
LPSSRVVGAFVFPEFWNNPERAKSDIAGLRESGVTAIMTESDSYEHFVVDLTHQAGLRFYAGVACFSDHASNFRWIKEHEESWPILETGGPRQQMEWYIGMPPTDRRRQKDVLAEVARIAQTYSIDGLFLDFVRWPLHWESELRPGRPRPLDSSFDAATLVKFEEATGSLPDGLDTVSARVTWIRENPFRAWVDFKCKVITDFVRMAREALKDVDRTVTRPCEVRLFSGHRHRRGKAHRKAFPGGRQVRGKTRLVDRSAGQCRSRRVDPSLQKRGTPIYQCTMD